MIVGFCGAAGSGKDTAAEALIAHKSFHKISFAAPLKSLLSLLFGWPLKSWDSLEWKETPNEACYGKTPRELAQTLGTDWGRNMVNPNLWVDVTLRGLPNGNFVFTDVRFPNEAEAIRKAGGILLMVKCTDRESGTDLTGHESEAWLPWLEVYTDATIEAPLGEVELLKEAAVNIIENYAYGIVPPHVPSTETQEALDEIATTIKA